MSFSDLMQSSRGPGVIGTLMALLVLGGFGGLSMLAFNESPPDQKVTVQAVIKEQATELEQLAVTIAGKQQKLTVIPKLKAAEAQLRDASREIRDSQSLIDSIKSAIDASQQQLAEAEADFDQYKDRYRAAARFAAKDEEIPKLQTRSGQTYEKVVVREVTAIGMQIRHQGGLAGIPFEELPADLQDRFQFDPKQKADALATEKAIRKAHESAVATTLTNTKQKNQERKEAEAAARQIEAKRAIAQKSAEIIALDGEIARLQGQLQQELTKKFKSTQQFTRPIADKQRQRTQLQAEIAELYGELQQ